MRSFGSDNHSGIHPEILTAICKANEDHAPSYGTDSITLDLNEKIKIHFGQAAQGFLVFNGTAANVLSLQALLKPYQAVLCAETSHLALDECAAPEFFCGAKIHTLPVNAEAKLELKTLKEALIRRGDQHFAQAKVLSLTQPTELGTCYSIGELKDIINWAHSENLYVHIDGARLANACYQLKTDFKSLTTDLDIDVVSLGGTKNGLMGAEMVIFLKSDLAKDFKYIRKQSAQLPSKSRFLSCQFQAYFTNDLWKRIAEHSCQMASLLKEELLKVPQIKITRSTQSNAVFAMIPQKLIKPLREHYFFYVWDEHSFECRLMTSWDTTTQDITLFVEKLKQLL